MCRYIDARERSDDLHHYDEGRLRSSIIAEIFIPLVDNFITSTNAIDHHLFNDAILTTGRMAKRHSWGTYYALVQKYLTLSERKDASERVYIHTLVALLGNFHFPMDEALPTEPIVEEIDGEGDAVSSAEPDGVNIRLLPKFLAFLEKHGPDTENHARISISSGIVTVVKHLPPPAREAQITRLLTILIQMLRSRSQELRDLVRDSLNRIAVSLGAYYMPRAQDYTYPRPPTSCACTCHTLSYYSCYDWRLCCVISMSG